MKPKMQWNYLFKNCFATLLIAPFLSDLFFFITPDNYKIRGFVNVYLVVLINGLLFSLPTYIIFAAVFYYLKEKQFSLIFSKRILVAISVVGVFITFMLIFPDMYFPATLAYMFTSLVTGIFFKLETENYQLKAKNQLK